MEAYWKEYSKKMMSKHKYIDLNTLKVFNNKDIKRKDVKNDIKKHHITGFANDNGESLIFIADALYSDYITRRANYEAYIESGLTARMLMELRLNAILPFDGECIGYYAEHNTAETPQDVINIRIKYCRRYLTPFYNNEGWRNFYLLKEVWGSRAAGVVIDYEPCFIDAKYHTNKTEYEYFNDAMEYIIPPMIGDGSGRFDWDRYLADRPEWVDEKGRLIEVVDEA